MYIYIYILNNILICNSLPLMSSNIYSEDNIIPEIKFLNHRIELYIYIYI